MSNYEIQWFNPSIGVPYVTVAIYGITFNKAASDELGNPRRVQIGIDQANYMMVAKPVNESEATLEKLSYPYAERERNGQTRVSSRDLISYIGLKFPELQLDKSIRFAAEWDEQEGMLIVNLQKPVSSLNDEETEPLDVSVEKVS